MKRKIFFALALFPLLALAQENATVLPAVIITELGIFESSDAEWIEIYNLSDAPQNLAEWKFFEDGKNHGLEVFRPSVGGTSTETVLNPQEFAIIANKSEIFAQSHPEYAGAIFDSSWGSLKEDGEEIGLKDTEGNFAEIFSYPASTGSSTASLERLDFKISASDPNNWKVFETPSFGNLRLQPNATLPPPAASPPSPPSPPDPSSPPPIPSLTSVPAAQPEQSPSPLPLSPPNSPPIAQITIQKGSLISLGETTINFDARSSYDPDGNPLIYFWDMGDGTVETSANPSPHKYHQPGMYVVILTVIDSKGAAGRAFQVVQVLQKPEIQNFSQQAAQQSLVPPPAQLKSNQPVNFPIYQPQILPLIPPSLEIRGFFVLQQEASAPSKQKKQNARKPKLKKKPSKSEGTKPKNGDLSTTIGITEIFPNPGPDDSFGEWIELSNRGDMPVNLGNWQIADLEKKSKPYLISDGIFIPPRGYIILPRSETRIVLNNEYDEVILSDFNGKIADQISYKDSKKGHSYALLGIKSSAELIASTEIPKRKPKQSWEWIDEPTPGEPNPNLEEIKGFVSRLIAGGGPGGISSLDITQPDGKTKTVSLAPEVLDIDAAEMIFSPGATVSLKALETPAGLEAKKIEEVRPAPKAKEKPPKLMWLGIALIALSVLLNLPPLLRFLREILRR